MNADIFLETSLQAELEKLEESTYPGVFISLEGIEGCGKSTQAALLAEKLRDEDGYEVLLTLEPGGTQIAEEIRDLLLRAPQRNTHTTSSGGVTIEPTAKGGSSTAGWAEFSTASVWTRPQMKPETEALLYAAARSEHVREVILPALQAGKIVITDRFVDSTLAYQGGGRELGFEFVLSLHSLSAKDLYPDITFFLDSDLETSINRARKGGGDRIEEEKLSFHRRVLDAYRGLSGMFRERFVSLDGDEPIEDISQEIYAVTLGLLLERGYKS